MANLVSKAITVDKLTSSKTSIMNSVLSKVLGGTVKDGVASGLSSTVQNQAASVKESLVSQASNLAGVTDVSSITKSLTDTASIFIKDSNKLMADKKLGSIMDTIAAGTSESQSKIQSLAGNSGEALAAPVSFISKSVKETLSGATTPSDTNGFGDLLPAGLDESALSVLATRTGQDNILTGSAYTSALSDISTSVSGNLSSAQASMGINTPSSGGFLSGVGAFVGRITSAVGNTVGSKLSGIGNQVSRKFGIITKIGSGIINSGISLLPDSMTSMISKTPDSLLAGKSDEFLSQFTDSVTNASLKLPFVDDVTSELLGINELGTTSTIYPKYKYADGSSAKGYNVNTSLGEGDMNSLYALSKSLCPDIPNLNISNFWNSKDLYDMLLALLGAAGLYGLLGAMTNCGKYFDDRSVSVLKNKVVPSAIRNGDIYTYNSAYGALGNTGISNSRKNLMYLNSNMQLDKDMEDAAEKIGLYEMAASNSGFSTSKLVEGNQYGTRQSFSSPNIAVMSNSNTSIIDRAVGSDIRNMGLQLLSAFS